MNTGQVGTVRETLFKARKQQVRTLHNTQMRVYLRILFPPCRCTGVVLDEQCEKQGSRNLPRISQQRNSEVVQVTLECEM